jgi:glutamate synthase (NADPH/NADH) small chain
VEEGARIEVLSQPLEVLGNADGEVTAVRCARTELVEIEPSGRRGVRPRPGTEFEAPADVVLVAYGFAPPHLPQSEELAQLAVDQNGCLAVDARQMTNLADVFAAGSIARWPISIVGVMRDARHAATEIDRYLAARPA